MMPPTIYDAYGKEIKAGDTVLYPVLDYRSGEPDADFVEFVIIAVDVWMWTKEYCDKFGLIYDPDLPPGFVLTAVDATDYVTLTDPEDMYRVRLADPHKVVVVTGLDLSRRHSLPPVDQRGYWTRPGQNTKRK